MQDNTNKADIETLIKFINNPTEKEMDQAIKALFNVVVVKKQIGIEYQSDNYCCLSGKLITGNYVLIKNIRNNNQFRNQNNHQNLDETRVVDVLFFQDKLNDMGPKKMIDLSLDYYEFKCLDGTTFEVEPNYDNVKLIFGKNYKEIISEYIQAFQNAEDNQHQLQQQPDLHQSDDIKQKINDQRQMKISN